MIVDAVHTLCIIHCCGWYVYGGIQSLDWTGLDWNGGLAEIVPKLVPRLNSNSVRYLE